MLRFFPEGRRTIIRIACRNYAKPKAPAGKGGKKGKPMKEIPKQFYRGPLDFSWWKKLDNEDAENFDKKFAEYESKSVADIKEEFANKIQKGRLKLTPEMYTKYVSEGLSATLKEPDIELDEDYEFFYDANAMYDIHAEPRMIGGKYGCKELRKQDLIPCIITGKGYPDFAIQIRKRAIRSFTETDQCDRLERGRKFSLVIEGRRYHVTPTDMLLDPVTLDPKFIQWCRLCDPAPKEKIKRLPRTLRLGGPPQRYPWMDHPHYEITVKKKPWMTEERRADRKKRKDIHIHDYLGIPR